MGGKDANPYPPPLSASLLWERLLQSTVRKKEEKPPKFIVTGSCLSCEIRDSSKWLL